MVGGGKVRKCHFILNLQVQNMDTAHTSRIKKERIRPTFFVEVVKRKEETEKQHYAQSLRNWHSARLIELNLCVIHTRG